MKRSIILLTLLIISIPLIHAGCFTYEGSLLYCQEISIEQATTECQLFEDCSTSEFFSDSECSAISQCDKILCKSSCQETTRGKCPSGEVPPSNAIEWCSTGCCSYKISSGNTCSMMSSNWRCFVEASNNDAQSFLYQTNISVQECMIGCADRSFENAQNTTTDTLRNIDFSEKTQLKEISPVVVQQQIQEEPKRFFQTKDLILFTIILTVLIIFLLYLYQKRSNKKPSLSIIPPSEKKVETTFSLPGWLVGVHKRLATTKKRRQRHVTKTNREEILAEFGVTPKEASQAKEFDQLNKLIRHYEKESKEQPKNSKISFVEYLESQLSDKQNHIQTKINSQVSKQEVRNVIDSLRKLQKK